MTNFSLSNFSNLQKQIFALLIPTIIIGGGLGFYLWSNQSNLPLNQPDPEVKTNEVVERGKKAVNALQGKIIKSNPDKLLYSEITLEELKIYPENWVKFNFAKNQRDNVLISGPEADLDLDGLVNAQEFLYGSNPNSKYTFCGDVKPDCQFTDKQLLDAGRSPLTNLLLELPKKFRIKKVDEKIIASVKESIGQASSEGVDFPKLYEQARTLNLGEDLKKVDITTVKDTRDSYLNYIQKRLEILQENNQTEELTAFSSVYKLVDIKKLVGLEDSFKKIKTELKALAAPDSLADFHRTSIFVVDKTLVVVEHRKKIIETQTAEDKTMMEKSQKNGRELFWAYRKLAEEQNKLGAILESTK